MSSTVRRDLRELAALAAPAAALQLASFTFGLVDAAMVGRVSRVAFDAATLGGIWIWGTLIFGMGVVFGIDPFVSQAFGAKDERGMALAVQRGVISAVLVSVPLMLLWLPTEWGLRALGQDPVLAHEAAHYVTLQIPSVAPFLVFTALRQYLVGRKIIAPAVWVLVIANLLNVVLDWMLIFGHFGAPAMGLAGSAIATTLVRSSMAFLLFGWIVARGLHRGAWRPWSRASFARAGVVKTFAYGLPVGVQMGLEVWAFQAATLMAGWLGDVALGAHSAVLNLASMAFMLPLGVSIGAATLVGNRIGERDLDGARRAARLSLAVGAGIQVFAVVAFTALRNVLPAIYTNDVEIRTLAAAILPIAGAFQLFDGTQAVGCGVLRGMGIPRPAAVFNLVGYYILGLPLAWWMIERAGVGLAGIWWSLALSLAVVAALLVFWIFRSEPRVVVLDGETA